MKIKCDKCGETVFNKVGNYRYNESGLGNVYLENITIYKCSCGAVLPSIFRLPRLNDLIALALIEKPSLLNGNEIKFLRKNLHLASKVFANKLGVGKTTLSKWENEIQKHSEGNDRLIRANYIIDKGIKQQDQIKIQKHLESLSLKTSNVEYVIIAQKNKDDYDIRYSPVLESQSEHFPLIGEFSAWENRGIATCATNIFNIFGFSVFRKIGQTDVPQGTPSGIYDASLIREGKDLYATQTA